MYYHLASDIQILGIEIIFDEQVVVPNHDLSLLDGAIAPWSAQEDLATSKRGQLTYEYYAQVLEGVANYFPYNGSTIAR